MSTLIARYSSVTARVAAVTGRRLLEAVLLLFAVSALTFSLLSFSNGDAATAIVQRRDGDVTAQAIQSERVFLGLDRPLWQRFGHSIDQARRGNWGDSLQSGRPVSQEIRGRIGPTAGLAAAGSAVAVIGGFGYGIAGTLVRRRWAAAPLRLAALGALSVPSFALAYLAVLVAALRLKWFPTQGMGGLRELVLPAVVLGLPLGAALARVVQARLRAAMSEPYITTARARGLTERACLVRHALPNAFAPLLVVVGNYIGYAIAGTLIVETIFGWPGLGAYLVQALQFRDWYPLQAAVLLVAAAAIVVRGLAGSLAAVIDPRTAGR